MYSLGKFAFMRFRTMHDVAQSRKKDNWVFFRVPRYKKKYIGRKKVIFRKDG